MPAEWLITNVSMDSTLAGLSSSGTRSAIDLFFGLRLSSTPTSPNWNEPSTRTTFLPSSVAAATARLTATVVRPTPPLGLKTRDDRARLAGRACAAGRAGPRPAAVPAAATGAMRRLLVAFSRVDLPDRRRQLVRAERLDQELAGSGQHRSAEVVRLALDGHHHDGRGRDGSADSCSVAAMPSMSGMLMSIRTTSGVSELGHLDGLGAGRRGADDLDVALEAEQLREVIAGLRDVVDDRGRGSGLPSRRSDSRSFGGAVGGGPDGRRAWDRWVARRSRRIGERPGLPGDGPRRATAYWVGLRRQDRSRPAPAGGRRRCPRGS